MKSVASTILRVVLWAGILNSSILYAKNKTQPDPVLAPIPGKPFVVDSFESDSQTQYRVEGKPWSWRGAKILEGDSKKNKKEMTREDGKVSMKGNAFWYVEGQTLQPGEALSLTITPALGTYIGLVVGDTALDIGDYSDQGRGNVMPLLFRTGPTEWELKTTLAMRGGDFSLRMVVGAEGDAKGNVKYDEKKHMKFKPFPRGKPPYFGKPVHLLVARGTGKYKNLIAWRITGPYANGQGKYVDNDLPLKAPFGLCHSVGGKKGFPIPTITDFKHGKLKVRLKKLPPLRLAPWVPKYRGHRQTWDNYRIKMAQAVPLLKSVNGTGKVTKKELASIRAYYEAAALPHSNMQNCNVFAFGKWSGPADMYRISGDIWFLNHAAKIAERIMVIGTKKEGILVTATDNWDPTTCKREVSIPGWFPHYRRCYYKKDSTMVTSCDTAQMSLLRAVSAFCVEVAKNKPLWDKVLPDGDPNHLGKTYRERALSYLDMLDESYRRMYPIRVEPKTFLFRYPVLPHGKGKDNPEWGIVSYNRWFMSIASFPPAATALELFGVHPERVKIYDKIVQAGIDNIKKHKGVIKKDGHTIWCWPYYTISKAPPGEDTGHGGATLNMLRLFYEEGRYQFTEQEMKYFAGTIRYLVFDPETKKASYTMSGTNKKGEPEYNKKPNYGSMVRYGKYFPEIDNWSLKEVGNEKKPNQRKKVANEKKPNQQKKVANEKKPALLSILDLLMRRAERWGVEGVNKK